MTKPSVWAVIPAAGVGSRVGASIPKQYISLLGRPLIEHTLQAFIDCDQIQGVMVALSAEDEFARELQILKHPKVSTCIGGDDRASSVLAGLQALPLTDGAWALVHDAARPCLTPERISAFITAIMAQGQGGLLAIPVADTLKRVNAQGCSVETIDRSCVWRAQTPQMFPYGVLVNALQAAAAQGLSITDEASAVEHAGAEPLLVEGYSNNIKVTYPEDVALAEFYLSQQGIV